MGADARGTPVGPFRPLPPSTAVSTPERVADHSLAAPGLLAQLLVSKYCDHLPFGRQAQIYWRQHGVFIARQQMMHWTAQSMRLLSGIRSHGRLLLSDLQPEGGGDSPASAQSDYGFVPGIGGMGSSR